MQMNCRFCNAEVGEEHKFCPYCGKAISDEGAAAAEGSEETVQMLCDENAAEEVVIAQEPVQKPKKKAWKLVLAIVGAVVALGVLAVVLLYALGVDLKPRANDILKKDSYTVEDDKAEKKSDVVIAAINGKELTNAQLQIYYRMQVIDFINYYGSYLSYIGMDYTQPLDEQTCAYDKNLTWQQYFLDVAIETWQRYQLLGLLAEEAGFEMGEEWKASLEEVRADLQEQAAEGEYESVDAMLEDIIGPGCTEDVYMEYVQLAYLSNEYYASEYERLTPNQEDIEAYFTENEESFKENNITKESGLISSVRHILIIPEGGTTDEAGTTTYSEDEWAACYAEAEKILNEWKAGAATEDSFAELANTHSEDGGSNTTGGLYEGIYYGSGMVEEFQNWAIDSSRQTGDTSIVKTKFGCHIMYFVSGEQNWINSARTNLLAERTSALIDDAEKTWPMKVTYGKIAIAELEL